MGTTKTELFTERQNQISLMAKALGHPARIAILEYLLKVNQAEKFHHNFPDPAKAKGSDEEILDEFRRVRDMIKEYCQEFAGRI